MEYVGQNNYAHAYIHTFRVEHRIPTLVNLFYSLANIFYRNEESNMVEEIRYYYTCTVGYRDLAYIDTGSFSQCAAVNLIPRPLMQH